MWIVRTVSALALVAAFSQLRAAESSDDYDPTITIPLAERVVVTAKNDDHLQEIDSCLGN